MSMPNEPNLIVKHAFSGLEKDALLALVDTLLDRIADVSAHVTAAHQRIDTLKDAMTGKLAEKVAATDERIKKEKSTGG